MNITKTEALILEQLVASAGSELYGMQMVKASGNSLKMGSIYVILGRLEDKGFVESRKEIDQAQTIPRRLYKITGAGKRNYHAWNAAMAAFQHGLSEGMV